MSIQEINQVTEMVGGKANAQLHAAEITTPTFEQIYAVSSFFRLHPFARFGAICSVETSLDKDISPVMAVAGTLANRLTDILRWQPLRKWS